MQLNIPILDRLTDSQNILIAGAGGGFDVFIGLPLYFTLRELGKTVHLANYSFSDVQLACRLSEAEILQEGLVVGVSGSVKIPTPYFPEGYLAQWFKGERGEDITVWLFAQTGVLPLKQGYAKLIEHLGIDTIILVDGGVDSLMRGDEAKPGSIVQDTVSLAAVKPLEIPVKILACLGFGTEVEEDVSHHHALQNIAALAKEGAFWGSCALTKEMEAFRLFEVAAKYVWEQPAHGKSHISTRIIPAVNGEFDNYHLYDDDHNTIVYISPLMSLYWFFDMEAVIHRSYLVDALELTRTSREASLIYRDMRRGLRVRSQRRIPY